MGAQPRLTTLEERCASLRAKLHIVKPLVERSPLIALALSRCTLCNGSGRLWSGADCGCVKRGLFRACYKRYLTLGDYEGRMAQLSYAQEYRPSRPRMFGRKREEYRADFELIARRTLDEPEYALFRLHFVAGRDWKYCCPRLKLSRGNFFHSVFRVEERLGPVYRDLLPYALFPLDEYFQETIRRPTSN
jgi:hypothetical protein